MTGGGPSHRSSRRDGNDEDRAWSFTVPNPRKLVPSVQVTGLALSRGILIATTDYGPAVALNASSGQLLWSNDGPEGAGSRFPVIAAADLAFLGQWNNLTAVDLGTGSEQWRFAVPDFEFEPGYVHEQLVGQPAVSGNQIVFGTTGPIVYSLDVSTGTLQWQTNVPGNSNETETAVVIAGTHVLVTSEYASSLYDLDLERGDVRWSHHKPYRYLASPGVAGETVVVSTVNGIWNVTGLRLEDGEPLWDVGIWLPDWTPHPPLLIDERVFVSGNDGHFHAYRLEDGERLWQVRPRLAWGCGDNPFHPFCSVQIPAPAYADDRLFAPWLDGVLYALNATTGAELWAYPLNSTELTSPIVAGATVFVGAGDRVMAIPIAEIIGAREDSRARSAP